MASETLSLKVIREAVKEGKNIYLHDEVPIHKTGGAMLKANTVLTAALINAIDRIHGDELTLLVGEEPIGEILSEHAGAGLGPIRMLQQWARDEARKPQSGIFANKGTLVVAARQAEAILATEPVSKADAFLREHLPPLAATKDRGVLATMQTHALADCLATLYLEEINPAGAGSISEEKQSARIASIVLACLLKDYGLAVEAHYLGERTTAEAHPAIGVHLLLGRDKSMGDAELHPDKLKNRTLPAEISDALRVILDHENIFSKSRLAQAMLRGRALSDWLIAAGPDAPMLNKECLQKVHQIEPHEAPHYFALAGLCVVPESRAALEEQARGNPTIRLALFQRFLQAKGVTPPVPDEDTLSKLFRACFSEFPDYDETGFEFVRHVALFNNRLQTLTRDAQKIKTATTAFATKFRNLLF